MATTVNQNMAQDREGMLTVRQKEIIRGDTDDLTDEGVRGAEWRAKKKIEQAADDLEFLRKHDKELYEYAVEQLCGDSTSVRERLDRIEAALKEQDIDTNQ